MKRLFLPLLAVLFAFSNLMYASDWTGAKKVKLTAIERMQYYLADGDWWFYIHGQREADAVRMDFNFDILAPMSGLEDGKLYTFSDMLRGTEPAADDFCFAVVDGEYLMYDDADFRLQRAENGTVASILAHVSLLGEKYELVYGTPILRDTVQMTFADGRIYRFTDEHQTRFDGWDATQEYNLSIMLKADIKSGHYTWKDVNQTFTYMKQFLPAQEGEENGEVNEFVFFDADVTLTETDAACSLDAYLSCTDGHCYHCTLTCPIPQAKNTVELGELQLYYDASTRQSNGFGYFRSLNHERYSVMLAIFPHQNEGMNGHFTERDLEAIYSMVADAETKELNEIYAAQLDVVRSETGAISLSGELLCYNNVKYTFTMACDSKYEYDAEEKDLDAHFLNAEVTVMDKYLKSNNVLSLLPARADYMAALLEFNVDYERDMKAEHEATGAYHIPAGIYPINDSEAAGTVSSSFGIVSDEPSPSYACMLEGEEYIALPFWFLVSGEVEVSYAGDVRTIEVRALNSYGKQVHIVIDDTAEGISPVQAERKAVKRIEKGMIVIEKDGKTYDVLGK